MTPKKIAATYERKINLGNYESATIGVTTWADIDDDETPEQAIQAAQDLCREAARREATRLLAARDQSGRQPVTARSQHTP